MMSPNFDDVPVPKNAVLPPVQEQQGVWTVPTMCHQKAARMSNLKGRWINHPWSQVTDYDELALFLMTFPLTYIKDILIPTMNKSLPSKDKMSLRKYIQWLGIIFFMAYFQGVSDPKQWFSKEPPKREGGVPFCCNDWMSNNQYEQIMQTHRFTDHNPPEFSKVVSCMRHGMIVMQVSTHLVFLIYLMSP